MAVETSLSKLQKRVTQLEKQNARLQEANDRYRKDIKN